MDYIMYVPKHLRKVYEEFLGRGDRRKIWFSYVNSVFPNSCIPLPVYSSLLQNSLSLVPSVFHLFLKNISLAILLAFSDY